MNPISVPQLVSKPNHCISKKNSASCSDRKVRLMKSKLIKGEFSNYVHKMSFFVYTKLFMKGEWGKKCQNSVLLVFECPLIRPKFCIFRIPKIIVFYLECH